MPKKVNHEQYRLELAQNAIRLFSEYGYTGLGMRKIAAELGISKSALYYYFPSKQALFHTCTDLATRFDGNLEDLPPDTEQDPSTEVKINSLVNIIRNLEPDFPKEMSLLLDYLRGNSKEEIANDPTMKLANQRYEMLVKQFVEEKDSKPVLCLLMGTLLMRFFDGGHTSLDEIENWLVNILNSKS